MFEKVLFMADSHIRSRTWTNFMQLQGDAYCALHKVSEQLQKFTSPPEVLIIGGDWFDGNRPSSVDVMETFRFLSQFKLVLFVNGNHDKIEPSFLEVLQGLDLPFTQILNLQNSDTRVLHCAPDFHIAGLNWTENASQLKSDLRTIADEFRQSGVDKPLHLVLHTSFQHLLGYDGSYKLSIKDIEEIFNGIQVRVLVGDIHTRDLTHISDMNDSYIHSPGSLYPRSFDKMMDEYAVSLIDTGTGEIKDIDCNVRAYYRYDYKSREELDQMVDIAKEDSKSLPLPPFIRVVMPKDSDVKILQTDYDGVVLQVVSSEAADHEEQYIRNTQDQYTLEQAVAEEADEDEDIRDMAVALVTADDPMAEIESWLKFWNVTRSTL